MTWGIPESRDGEHEFAGQSSAIGRPSGRSRMYASELSLGVPQGASSREVADVGVQDLHSPEVQKWGCYVTEDRMSFLKLMWKKPLEVVWMQPAGRRTSDF